MALKAGIVGLPNVGKSTLFNAITLSSVEAANYPFATIEPNVGTVELFDVRIDNLAKLIKPNKILRATFEFIDIAGLVEGASKGEGLGNKFLANIRETDAIIQVVRCFEDPNITHVTGSVDPIRDIDVINMELLFADIETILNVIKRTERIAKNTKEKKVIFEFKLAKKILAGLEKEIFARDIELTDDEKMFVKGYQLLTFKPMIYVANIEEKFVANPEKSALFNKMKNKLATNNLQVLPISASIEGEIATLNKEEREVFLTDLGIGISGLDKLARSTFNLLNLATYFTAGIEEVRAWTFTNGYTAPQCAGIIHTDFEKGFIKAEVISYEDYMESNGEQGAKDAGKLRLEGKNYLVKDGDICHFKFNL